MSRLRYAGLTGTVGSGNMTNSATSHTFTAALTYASGVTVPTLTGSDDFLLSILDSSGNLSEIVQVTAYDSSTKVATIVRGQEGTSGVSHTSGDKVTMGAYSSDFSAFTKVIDLPLSTLTGWTAGAGTWTVASSVIKETATAASASRLHLNTFLPLNDIVVEWEQRIDASSGGHAGIVIGTPPTSDGDFGFVAGFTVTSTQTTVAYTEVDGQVAGGGIALASVITNGTWYKVKIHKSGAWVTYWLDTGSGYVLVGTLVMDIMGAKQMGRLAFKTYNTQVSFRNLKVWNRTMPV